MEEKNLPHELALKVLERSKKVGRNRAIGEFICDIFTAMAMDAKDEDEFDKFVAENVEAMKRNNIPREAVEIAIDAMEKSIKALGEERSEQ